MPEGVEKTILKPDIANLVAFLHVSHRDGDNKGVATSQPWPLDMGTLPGLIELDQ
jgi:hypothetical protein